MITFHTNNKEFNNDLYSLTRAFYPLANVKVEANDMSLDSLIKDYKADCESSDLIFFVLLEEDSISVELYINDNSKQNLQVSEQVSYYNKRFYRNSLKRLVYTCLNKASGKTLSWGTLTGVRPTKIVLDMLEARESKENIISFMKEQYYISRDKVNLSLQIAKKELELLENVNYRDGYSLYIGIPFCPSTCLYCSFASYSMDKFEDKVELYLDALIKEITFASTYFRDKKLTTIYIGGGTPTSLSEKQLERLLDHIQDVIDFTYVKEYTVEAGRPDSINKEKLKILKKYKVSRISINPQSMSQKTLDLIGRKHSVEDVNRTFHLAREVGHNNINMDIIIGLPGENINDVSNTLKSIDKLQADSLTVHALAIKRAARLNIEMDDYKDLRPDDSVKMRLLTEEYADKAGYYPYYLYRQKNVANNIENIGYAKPGKEGLYNVLMMEDKHNVLALGAGALSKFVSYDKPKIRRVENVKSLKDYIERIDEMIDRKKKFKEEFL